MGHNVGHTTSAIPKKNNQGGMLRDSGKFSSKHDMMGPAATMQDQRRLTSAQGMISRRGNRKNSKANEQPETN